PSAEMPPRTGTHSARDCALSGAARSAAVASDAPAENLPPGIDIATSLANIAEIPETRSVFALAAEYARSTARSSSMTLCGESLSRPGVFGDIDVQETMS